MLEFEMSRNLSRKKGNVHVLIVCDVKVLVTSPTAMLWF